MGDPKNPMTGGSDYHRNNHFWRVTMNNLNSIIIEGNLVRDCLLRSTPKGTPVCTFSMASNRFYKQEGGFEKEVSFFEVESWAKLAMACNRLGHKGRGVRVVGRLKQDRWSSADGTPHSKISIVAEHVEFRPEFKRDAQATSATAEAAAEDMAGEAFEDISSMPGDGMAAEDIEELAMTF
jgi:single-strand DNA-binding protein